MPQRKPEVTRRIAAGIPYELTRKKVKRLNLHIRRDGTVAVSIPWSYTVGFADAFVTEQAQWIREAVSRQLRRNARNDQPLPSQAEALACFTAMSDKVYPAFAGVLGGQKPTIRVRDMTSRWGVCYMKRRQITFALQLYNMPPAAQIYVVVHEYCHFLQPNHSPAFWAEVEKLLPDWKERAAAATTPPPPAPPRRPTSPSRGGKSGTTVFLALLLGELQSEAERFCPKVYRKLLGVCTFRGK